MIGGLAGSNHIIVATDTGTGNLIVIDPARRHRYPVGRQFVMTGITLV